MWKKEDDQAQQSTVSPPRATATRTEAVGAQTRKAGFATIGPSIVIRGEVTGDEDLLIQGQVDGSVALGLHSVTIGDGGRVKAGVTGRVITVEGAVEGDLTAEEQIILRGTARVKGDLNAPRVVLEDGATFRGLVDMGRTPDLDASGAKDSKSVATKSATQGGSKPESSVTQGGPKPEATPTKAAEQSQTTQKADGGERARATSDQNKGAAAGGAQRSANG